MTTRHGYISIATVFGLVLLLTLTIYGTVQAANLKNKRKVESQSNSSDTDIKSNKPVIYAQLGHGDRLRSISITPDGKYVVSASVEGTIKLWDMKNGRLIRTFGSYSFSSNTFAITPDGKHILTGGGGDNSLKLWEFDTGKHIRTYKGHDAPINSISISPDGRYALSGSGDTTLKLWDISSGRQLRTFKGHSELIRSVVFTSNGQQALSGSFDKTMRLWDVHTGKTIRTFSGHKNAIWSVITTPDGENAITGSSDNTLKLWNLKSGRLINTVSLGEFIGDGSTLAITPDGKKVLHCGNETTRIFDLFSGLEEKTFPNVGGYSGFSVAISPDGRNVITGNSNSLYLWDLSTGKIIWHSMLDSTESSAMAISHDGRYAMVAEGSYKDAVIKYWDIENGKQLWSAKEHKSTINSVKISSDGKYALTGSDDETLKLWDVKTGKELKTLAGHAEGVYLVSLSPNGKFAASASKLGELKLWNLQTEREIWSIKDEKNIINDVVFSPDGQKIFIANLNNGISTVDINNNQLLDGIKDVGQEVMSLAISTNGRQLLAGGTTSFTWTNQALTLWNVANGEKIWTSSSENLGQVKAVAISPAGNYAVSGGSDRIIRLWNISDGQEIRTFSGHAGSVLGSVFSNSGKNLLSIGKDNTTRLWNISTGKELAQFISFTDGEWIVITPDGYYNSSPNGDKHLNVRIGNSVYGIDNYREAFFRPDLVKITLSGNALKGYRKITDVKPPPQVEIFDTPMTVAGDELTVKLKLSDTGGGIGDVRLYLNGSAIKLDNTRGLKVVEKGNKPVATRSYNIRLARGDNIIRAVAFNAENSMQSNPTEQTVTATYTQSAKPTLHALVIGINEFNNPKLRLQYAVPDADLFTETLKKGASDMFGKINIVLLTKPEQTSKENIANELKKMQKVNPEDLFILFVASHGTVDDGEYFLITSNVGSTSTAKLKTDALSQDRIKELVANIPATKKVIVLDTCNAGQMGDAIQVAMLTRGMSEDTAFKILSRAVGSTILSSATSTQEALEGYQGHGLFTWVLTEGMKGKADKGKSGYIKTTDLVDYVESEVPEIAEKHFKRKQYPTTAVSGQGFPIGMAGR
jgi:WD40 repeat protein